MSGAGWSRVTHPFATLLAPEGAFSFDLHVLGTPPAFILSQDQTLRSKGDPVSGAPAQTDSVPVWKCCLSIRTAASGMRRIKINVKDRNDGSLSLRPPCVHPNNSLAYHNLPFVHFVWTVSGSQGPRGPAARRPARLGSTPAPCGARKYITRFPSPCQQDSRDFFREPASGGPARALGAAGVRTLRLPRARVKGDLGSFPKTRAGSFFSSQMQSAPPRVRGGALLAI